MRRIASLALDGARHALQARRRLRPAAYYDPDARRGQLFAVGAGSPASSPARLFGLAAFNTSRRYKEIGIRKTLGPRGGRGALLIGEFLRRCCGN